LGPVPDVKLLVFHGPATGVIDLAVWVSRDEEDSLPLMDMLSEQWNSTDFQEAALVLAGHNDRI
jgi:hypothetical protein